MKIKKVTNKKPFKKNIAIQVLALSLIVSTPISVSAANGEWDDVLNAGSESPEDKILNDTGCSIKKTNLEEKAQKKYEEEQTITTETEADPEGFFESVKACLDEIGGGFNNPFQLPNFSFGDLGAFLCKKAQEAIIENNPISKAVDGVSISDPTGQFSYNPSFNLNKSGKFENTETVTKSQKSTGDILFKKLEDKLPGSQDIWGKTNKNIKEFKPDFGEKEYNQFKNY